MKTFFSLLAMLFPLMGSAQPSMFAGYDSFCGLPVLVESTSQDAVATIRNGQRVILVDPSVMSNWKLSRIFALAHECGHHRLGHLSPQQLFSRAHMNATRAQELAADCWAAKALAKNGYHDDIKRAIIQNESEGPMMNGPYPSGMERASYIAQCAGIALNTTASPEVGPSAVCLAEMDRRCMTSCQNNFGNSAYVCRNQMCNSTRQAEANIRRCTR